MGTRSLTHIYDAESTEGTPLLTIYRQFDGHPDAMGIDLAEFSKNMTLRNGFRVGDKEGTHANGMQCFAAQLVKFLKNDIGNVYIYPAGSKDCGEEYTYRLYKSGDNVRLKCDEEKFDGTPTEFIQKYSQ